MDTFPLPAGDLADSGLRTDRIDALVSTIERHVADGHYPGCQFAIARRGRLLLERSIGLARVAPARVPASRDTLWLMYSNTKVIVATALWRLAEDGAFGFGDRVSDHVPDFARHGKRDVTIHQVITHQGGFPNAQLDREGWDDRGARLRSVCDFTLEWTPGSRISYHPLSAHWVLAVLIESLTRRDFREVLRDTVIEPLGLGADLVVGLRPEHDARAADMHEPLPAFDSAAPGLRIVKDTASATWKRGGAPGGGGYGTARGLAALYQMMLAGGTLGGHRLLSPRTLAYALRDHTGDRIDDYMGMPMHRGLGPHLRGTTPSIRGLGSLAAPDVFGHGGVGSSYCWADPASGVSFAYLTNSRVPDPWHSLRMDRISNLVHAAIVD
jgi:CubicO group peptidase (beta-lactamase class C family)